MLEIKNKIEFEDNLFVGEVNASSANTSKESRIKFVTDIASVCLGRLGYKSPNGMGAAEVVKKEAVEWTRRKNLYNRLLTESAGKPSVPFEFVPISFIESTYNPIDLEDLEYYQYVKIFDYFYGSNLKHELSGYNLKFNTPEEVKDFKIIVGQVPYEVIKYLGRKSAFSLICELDNTDEKNYKRYLNEVEFWYPSWWDKGYKGSKEYDDIHFRDILLEEIDDKLIKPEEATMELSDRRLVKFAIAAWKTDKSSWSNLFAVSHKSVETQSIAALTIDKIKKLINI